MENTNSPRLLGSEYEVIPQNPRVTSINSVELLDVYVKISLSILKRPCLSGNPFVDETVIVVSDVLIPDASVVIPTITSGVKLSNFKY